MKTYNLKNPLNTYIKKNIIHTQNICGYINVHQSVSQFNTRQIGCNKEIYFGFKAFL